jgi:hypothetical protein
VCRLRGTESAGHQPHIIDFVIAAGFGVRVQFVDERFTEMAPGTGESGHRLAAGMLFAGKPTDDVVIDSVAMAINALHSGSKVHVFVMHPPGLNPRFVDGPVAVALEA